MHNAVILLGTNTGELLSQLSEAIRLIENRCGAVVKRSSVYKTEPWGNTDQPFFLNQVIEIGTSLSPGELLSRLLKIEAEMGRKRSVKWEPRTIDLDILFFEDRVIKEEGLTIPHPHLHERRFTLVPLNEILPRLMHPVLRKTVGELLSAVPDGLVVAPLEPESLPKNRF